MQFSMDPEFLTLIFALAAASAVAYFFVYRLLTRLRIRALGLTVGTMRIPLSTGSSCDVEFRPQKGSGNWFLAIRVKSLQSRNYKIPLPITEGSAFAKLDRDTIEFGRQAFEIGMDWISQQGQLLEIGSKSFRPIQHGHTGFVDRLARGLEKVDWKLACAEGESALDDISKTSAFGGPRTFAVAAAVGALFLSWVEPVINHGAVLVDSLPAYYGAFAISCIVFIWRFVHLRNRFADLKRKPPLLGNCFWPALGAGMLALIPIQHLDMKFDMGNTRTVSGQVIAKRTVQNFSGSSYLVNVKRTDGSEAWMVEIGADDYASAVPGKTLVTLKFHSGAFGMEWIERTQLDDLDRGIASGN